MSVVGYRIPLHPNEVNMLIEVFGRAVTYRDLYNAFSSILGPQWLLPVANGSEVMFTTGVPLPNNEEGFTLVESSWIEEQTPDVVDPGMLKSIGAQFGPPRETLFIMLERFMSIVYQKLNQIVTPEALESFAGEYTLSDLVQETLSRILNLDLSKAQGKIQNDVHNVGIFSVRVRHLEERGERLAFAPKEGMGPSLARMLIVLSMLRRAEETALPGVAKTPHNLARQETREEQSTREKAQLKKRKTAKEARDEQTAGVKSLAKQLLYTGITAEDAVRMPAKWMEVCDSVRELLDTCKKLESQSERGIRAEVCRAALGIILGFAPGEKENEILYKDTGFMARGLRTLERMDKDSLREMASVLLMLLKGAWSGEMLEQGQLAEAIAVEILARIANWDKTAADIDTAAIDVAWQADMFVEEADNIISECVERVVTSQESHEARAEDTQAYAITAAIHTAVVMLVWTEAIAASSKERIEKNTYIYPVAAGLAAAMQIEDAEEAIEAGVAYLTGGRGQEEAEESRSVIEEAVEAAEQFVKREEREVNALELHPWSVLVRFAREA